MKEVIITDEIKKELQEQNKSIINKATELEVKSEADNIRANELLKTIKGIRTKIEDTFNPLVKATKKAYDEARGLRDTYLDPIENAERQIRCKISAFLTAEEQRRMELQKKADEKFQKAVEKAEKTGKPLTIAPTIIDTKIKTAEGVSYQEKWNVEVIDITKLPPEYLLPNLTLLNKVAQTMKEKFNIPGCVAKKTLIPKARI